VLFVLHLHKGAEWLRAAFAHPQRPRVVAAIAGTDLYGDQPLDLGLLRNCERIVALQPDARQRLPAELRARTRVLRQSAVAPRPAEPRDRDAFTVAVLAHLRAVKDPFLPAEASALLPSTSKVAIFHAGAATDAEAARSAAQVQRRHPRWHWLGPLPRPAAAELLSGASLCLVPSRSEGGASVISEACVAGVGLLATRVPGNVGLLGPDHPGLFPAGDARALAALLLRAETEPRFLDALRRASRELAPLFDPAVERAALAALLAELRDLPRR
jgi:glycosyltransferase involved in cell wall biosynthesis